MPSVLAKLAHVAKSRDPSINQRRAPRVLVDLVSHMAVRGQTHGIRVINISPLGLMCRSDADVTIGERVAIWLPVVKEVMAEVRWAEDGRVGVEFRQPIEGDAFGDMMLLTPPRQTAW